MKALEAQTQTFAQRRMDAHIREAMAGKKIEHFE